MSFQVPRRDHFPRPPGDNSQHTPADPEPAWPPYRPPSAEDYRLARSRWEQTGELAALWEMLDNVAARPWPGPAPSPALSFIQAAAATVAATPVLGHRKRMRQVAVSFGITVTGILCFLVGIGVIR
jgi:hypothetical protein